MYQSNQYIYENLSGYDLLSGSGRCYKECSHYK